MHLSDEQIKGLTVISADGKLIGEIRALLLDTDGWNVQALEVTLRKDIADALGAHRSIFHAGVLELPVHMVQSVGAAVILSVPVEGLRAVLPAEPGSDVAQP